MVNDNRDTTRARTKILELLRLSEEPVSGEYLAGELGMSRVAVWKHIRTLEEHGYRFDTSKRGYTLASCPDDSLLPWDIRHTGSRVSHFGETDSTMNRALEAALSGAEAGSLFVADRQVAGRGTGEKQWESAEGGLFFTLLLRPSLHPAHYFRAVAAAQCALVETLREKGLRAEAAWPNDILAWNDDTAEMSKAGGILCEHLSSGNTVRFLNLGIGMNTGNAPRIKGSARLQVNRRDLLEGFLERIAADSGDETGLEERWQSLSAHTRGECEILEKNTVIRGSFLGMDRFGNARFRSASDSEERRFLPGSVSILNKGRHS